VRPAPRRNAAPSESQLNVEYLVLMQRTWLDDPGYLDVEGVIYHYPQRYFAFINGYERFLYYRPSRGASANEASSYFGYGTLGEPFADPDDATHRFVPIRQFRRFPDPVGYDDPTGRFYESGFTSRTGFTGRSVRRIAANDYFRVLAAAGIHGDAFIDLADSELVFAVPYSPLPRLAPPKQPLQLITHVPPGTGYKPTGKVVDVAESAALQERARSDHQHTLRIIQALVHERGGETLYNNNVDMFARVRGQRLLIEAKSIRDPRVVVDRMRYGIGQLADYAIRYKPELGDAERVLAFGAMPPPDSAWIATILQESSIAFVALEQSADRVLPLNDRARSLSLFDAA
jgi:hypothetical protein